MQFNHRLCWRQRWKRLWVSQQAREMSRKSIFVLRWYMHWRREFMRWFWGRERMKNQFLSIIFIISCYFFRSQRTVHLERMKSKVIVRIPRQKHVDRGNSSVPITVAFQPIGCVMAPKTVRMTKRIVSNLLHLILSKAKTFLAEAIKRIAISPLNKWNVMIVNSSVQMASASIRSACAMVSR